MTEDPDTGRTKGWWQTVPGMLTAMAGLMTAAAGLLVALNQVGLLGGHGHAPPAAPAEAASPSPQAAPTATPAGPPAAARTVTYAAGAKVTLNNNRGKGTYELLAAKVEPRTPEVATLTLTIRLTNAGPADIGFWNDSFRLAVDGVPRAPTSRLNSSVDARSAKEADVAFDLPLAAHSLVLKLNSGDEEGEIPLTLQRTTQDR
jgi:hypothetical protein